MKLYTVVVHNLQMCMKEYRCSLQFSRGDNSTYTFTKRGIALTRYMDGWTDGQTDGQGDSYIPPQTLFAGGIKSLYLQMCMKEYRCCLKFSRGDNSTYTFTKRGVVYFVSATPTKLFIEFL
jgi:hypothetical protein